MSEQPGSPGRETLIVFQQELRVELVNLSRCGCLLHVSRPLRVGAIARLRVALDDTEYADHVRVARCESLEDATCEIGVELLWMPKLKEPRRGASSLASRLQPSSDHGFAVMETWPNGT